MGVLRVLVELTLLSTIISLTQCFRFLPWSSLHHRKVTKRADTVDQHLPQIGVNLVNGLENRVINVDMKSESDALGRKRREDVKSAMLHAWTGYRKYAWGRDEVLPLTKGGRDNWGGMGMTLVDSLDTLWLMGLKDEFNEARDWVDQKLNFANVHQKVSVFETTIRMLGGLLSGYEFSKDDVFLKRAEELGNRLLPAFNTPTGIPNSHIVLSSGATGVESSAAALSEFTTLQLEFRYLAHHSGRIDLEKVVMKPLQLLREKHPPNGLFPVQVNINSGQVYPNARITMGALGDSFYEYLLKVWLQGSRKENWLRNMYDDAMDGVMNMLLQTSTSSRLTYVAELTGQNGRVDHRMEHLVCFLVGTLAIGAFTHPEGIDSPKAQRDLAVAKALMFTFRETYRRSPTGIGPEYVEFLAGDSNYDYSVPGNGAYYILRPEVVESLFILHELTGDPTYREWSWEIFQSIQSNCRTNIGYCSLDNVRDRNSVVDRMESFFLSETLKYLYLIQDPDHSVDLSKYVFNTEAHPLSVLNSSHVPIE